MRYKFKRYYVTLVIPIIIAVVIMAYALYTGFAPVPNLGPVQNNTVENSALLKLEELQLLFPNSTQVSTGGSSPTHAIKIAAPPSPQNFEMVLLVAMFVALGPYAIDATRRDRLLRRRESDFTDFLFELSELVRGGIDPIKAVNTLAQGNVGSITKEVKMVAKQMQIGYTFEQAMRNLAITLKSPLIDKYVDLVVQASYSGGSVANLIQRASADMSTFLSIDRDKRAGLAQYTVILYTAQIVLIVLAAILVIEFLPDLSEVAAIGGTSLAGILGTPDIQNVNLSQDLFYLVIINGFLGGLVIGKVSESSMKHGIKHALILILVGFLAWTLFVTPASGSTAHYDLTVVSYDKNGLAGLPETDPLIVQVNNTGGSAAVGALVEFGIAGPTNSSSGSLTPTSANTGSSGQAQTEIILGADPGIYTVSITVGDNETIIPILASSGPLSNITG